MSAAAAHLAPAGLAAALASPNERSIAVPGPLGGLFPGGGLRRGSVVALGPRAGPASHHPAGRATPMGGTSSLTLALLAAVSADGGWVAAVGMLGLGALAAAELGVPLERLAAVPDPGPRWPGVVAALLDAVDAVAVRMPSGRAQAADCRRLAARARERRAVLLPVGPWDGADLALTVTSATWSGLDVGWGRLRGRELRVRAQGRGAAAQPREASLWLPAAEASPQNARSKAHNGDSPRRTLRGERSA